jgi:hypothetical protein
MAWRSILTIGLVQNGPTLCVSRSAGSITIPLRRRRPRTAFRTAGSGDQRAEFGGPSAGQFGKRDPGLAVMPSFLSGNSGQIQPEHRRRAADKSWSSHIWRASGRDALDVRLTQRAPASRAAVTTTIVSADPVPLPRQPRSSVRHDVLGSGRHAGRKIQRGQAYRDLTGGLR